MKGEKVIDPVCKMPTSKDNAVKVTYKGKDYYLCSPTCQWAFKSDPEQFTKEKTEDKK